MKMYEKPAEAAEAEFTDKTDQGGCGEFKIRTANRFTKREVGKAKGEKPPGEASLSGLDVYITSTSEAQEAPTHSRFSPQSLYRSILNRCGCLKKDVARRQQLDLEGLSFLLPQSNPTESTG